MGKKYLVLSIVVLLFLFCSNPTSNVGNPQVVKDKRLIGKWFGKNASYFSKIIFTDASYYQLIDSIEFKGDWKTRNDSLIIFNGDNAINTYKVISKYEWWESHPYFIWIPYVRDSNLTDSNIIDSSYFNTEYINLFTDNYLLLNLLSYTITPNISGYDTTYLLNTQGEMTIDNLKTMKQIITKSGSSDTTISKIINIEKDTVLLCYNGKLYVNYSTKIKNDTLSLYSVIWIPSGKNDVKVTYWLKKREK